MDEGLSKKETQEFLATASEALKIGNGSECWAVLNQLGTLGKKALPIVPDIIKLLNNTKDIQTQRDCVIALGEIGGNKAIVKLNRYIKDHFEEQFTPYRPVVHFAIEAILELKDKKSKEVFLFLFLNSINYLGSKKIVDILLTFDDKETISLLEEILTTNKFTLLQEVSSPNKGYNIARMNVLEKLCELRPEKGLHFIHSIITKECSASKLERALEILRNMPNKKELFPVMLEMLDDSKRKDTYYFDIFQEYLIAIGEEESIPFIIRKIKQNHFSKPILLKMIKTALLIGEKAEAFYNRITELSDKKSLTNLEDYSKEVLSRDELYLVEEVFKDNYIHINNLETERKEKLLLKIMKRIKAKNVVTNSLLDLLEQYPKQQVIQILVEIVKNKKITNNRISAFELLAKIDKETAEDLSIGIIESNYSLEIQTAAVKIILYRLKSSKGYNYLLSKRDILPESLRYLIYDNIEQISPSNALDILRKADESNIKIKELQLSKIKKIESSKLKLRYSNIENEILNKIKQGEKVDLTNKVVNILLDNFDLAIGKYLLEHISDFKWGSAREKVLNKIAKMKDLELIFVMEGLLESDLEYCYKVDIKIALLKLGNKGMATELYPLLEDYLSYDLEELAEIAKLLALEGDKQRTISILREIRSANIPTYNNRRDEEEYNRYYDWTHELLLDLDNKYALNFYLEELDELPKKHHYVSHIRTNLDKLAYRISFSEYVSLIENDNYLESRIWGIENFADRFSNEEVAPFLISILDKHPQNEIFNAILNAFQVLKLETILPKLVELFIKEDSYHISQKLFDTIQQINPIETFNLFRDKFDLLEKYRQVQIIRLLGKNSNAKSFLEFIQSSNLDEEIKEEAFWSLEKIAGRESLPSLLEETEMALNLLEIDFRRIKSLNKKIDFFIPILIQKTEDAIKEYYSNYYDIRYDHDVGGNEDEYSEKIEFYTAIYESVEFIMQYDIHNGFDLFFEANKHLDDDTYELKDPIFETLNTIEKSIVIDCLLIKIKQVSDRATILDLLNHFLWENCSHVEQIIDLIESGYVTLDEMAGVLGSCESELVARYLINKIQTEKITEKLYNLVDALVKMNPGIVMPPLYELLTHKESENKHIALKVIANLDIKKAGKFIKEQMINNDRACLESLHSLKAVNWIFTKKLLLKTVLDVSSIELRIEILESFFPKLKHLSQKDKEKLKDIIITTINNISNSDYGLRLLVVLEKSLGIGTVKSISLDNADIYPRKINHIKEEHLEKLGKDAIATFDSENQRLFISNQGISLYKLTKNNELQLKSKTFQQVNGMLYFHKDHLLGFNNANSIDLMLFKITKKNELVYLKTTKDFLKSNSSNISNQVFMLSNDVMITSDNYLSFYDIKNPTQIKLISQYEYKQFIPELKTINPTVKGIAVHPDKKVMLVLLGSKRGFSFYLIEFSDLQRVLLVPLNHEVLFNESNYYLNNIDEFQSNFYKPFTRRAGKLLLINWSDPYEPRFECEYNLQTFKKNPNVITYYKDMLLVYGSSAGLLNISDLENIRFLTKPLFGESMNSLFPPIILDNKLLTIEQERIPNTRYLQFNYFLRFYELV